MTLNGTDKGWGSGDAVIGVIKGEILVEGEGAGRRAAFGGLAGVMTFGLWSAVGSFPGEDAGVGSLTALSAVGRLISWIPLPLLFTPGSRTSRADGTLRFLITKGRVLAFGVSGGLMGVPSPMVGLAKGLASGLVGVLRPDGRRSK